jgi:LDH2 family malate/lactate/ureidoglycolate dehydrogenase/uncharacterized OsmC-like protein
MPSPHTTAARWALADLESWLAALLARAELPTEAARQGARQLLLADAFGIYTHGLARWPTYWDQLRRKMLHADATVHGRWQAGVFHIETNRGFGPWAGEQALMLAQGQLNAQRRFVPFLIHDAGHLGALATHVYRAAQAGSVALLMQSTQPVMAGIGASGPAIGNNPIAFAAPRPGAAPLLIDFAASQVAFSHVLDAHREGRPIPDHWAIDSLGRPTTDAAAALQGAMQPMAGHKGLALAMIVQVLAGVLTNASPDLAEPSAAPGCGAFGFVASPDIAGPEAYARKMQEWVDNYQRVGGAAARVPGDRAIRSLAQALDEGIPIAPALVAELKRIGDLAGVPLPGPVKQPLHAEQHLTTPTHSKTTMSAIPDTLHDAPHDVVHDAHVVVSSSNTHGRFTASNARFSFVTDAKASNGGPGVAVNAAELLLSSLGSCGLALVYKRAEETGAAVRLAKVKTSLKRSDDDGTRYDFIRLVFQIEGVARDVAQDLVDHFTSNCPIFNTLLRGGSNITVRLEDS